MHRGVLRVDDGVVIVEAHRARLRNDLERTSRSVGGAPAHDRWLGCGGTDMLPTALACRVLAHVPLQNVRRRRTNTSIGTTRGEMNGRGNECEEQQTAN